MDGCVEYVLYTLYTHVHTCTANAVAFAAYATFIQSFYNKMYVDVLVWRKNKRSKGHIVERTHGKSNRNKLKLRSKVTEPETFVCLLGALCISEVVILSIS